MLSAYYSPFKVDHPFVIDDLEVNPFVVQNKKLIALDGMCRFSFNQNVSKRKRYENIKYLLKPESIGIIGVSKLIIVDYFF